MSFYISKSQYCSAVQCPKMLWMKQHMPDEFDSSVMNEAVLVQGSEVGDLAMGLSTPSVRRYSGGCVRSGL